MKLTVQFVLCATSAVMVNAAPYIGYVYPSGGQQGTTIQLLVGGSGIVSKLSLIHI